MARQDFKTHEVFNQSPVFGGHNVWSDDPLLQRIGSALPSQTREGFSQIGKWAGSAETLELAQLANRQTPVLKTHDGRGNRIDKVDYHPAYHAFMRRSVASGLHCSLWEENNGESGHRQVARAIRFYLTSQAEAGHLCPLTMTNASVAALKTEKDIAEDWLPLILSRKYDPSNKPPVNKSGVMIGMGMTEKQGGTDVRANTSTATPGKEGIWSITGHKWFFSAPMSDAFIILAQAGKDGLGCFLVPRLLPDGSDNGFRFQRLKEKLGNRSNASAEVEFHASLGQLIGEQGKGISTILQMVSQTRLDCAIASAGLMRTAIWEAVHHCRNRSVTGNHLIDQPLMQSVLADLSIDMAAATALSFRLAQAWDRQVANPAEAAYARLMTPVTKYWVCKIAPAVAHEALECLGGNGYVEESNLARHYREAPLNGLWEGSGNVMCLDVLRVLAAGGDTLDQILTLLERDIGPPNAGKTVDVIRTAAQMAAKDPGAARILTEQLALTAAAAELRRIGLEDLADAFIETRLGGLWRSSYGMLDSRQDAAAIINALYPAN